MASEEIKGFRLYRRTPISLTCYIQPAYGKKADKEDVKRKKIRRMGRKNRKTRKKNEYDREEKEEE